MNSLNYPSESDLTNAVRTGQPSAFARLYDQYAPVLLGVITKIVDDEQQAGVVLAKTFVTACSDVDKWPANQPLFLWLFGVARQIAADILATAPKVNPSTVQLTASGKVVTGTGQPPRVQPATSTRQKLLNAVLFERCTPQEASRAAGLPAEHARQHLRQAFLQLRGHEV